MVAIDSTDTLINVLLKRKLPFIGVFFVTFLCTFAVLYALDFYPELVPSAADEGVTVEVINRDAETSESVEVDAIEVAPAPQPVSYRIPGQPGTPQPFTVAAANENIAALPQELVIDSLGYTMQVLNPTSRSVAELDEALLDGVVRHPDSATFTNEGNIFILGHSSYLPNVFNKNFQAFNGIQNLEWGDTIRLRSTDTEYIYRVDSVYHAKADNLTVPIAGTGPRLTLATCNSFGTKDDRYIVEATLVGQKTL